jgi:anthranilate phosphoribosyltransferase
VFYMHPFSPSYEKCRPNSERISSENIFNMLGPMVTFPKKSIGWCFNLELARMYAYLYQNTDVNFTILHSLDGYDDSLTSPTKTITSTMEGMLLPEDFGVSQSKGNRRRNNNRRFWLICLSILFLERN